MIRTPLGQWINEDLLPFANIDFNPYDNFYWLAFYYTNGQRQLISSGYDTKEEAQSELDKMFNPKFTCESLPGNKTGLPTKVYNAPKEYHETLQIIADFESNILKLSKKDY